MENRDHYIPLTASLNRAARTGPLTAPAPDSDADPRVRTALEAAVAKSRDATPKLEPRIEVLHRSCERAALPVPGVGAFSPRHTLPANGESILGYLEAAMRANTRLAETVRVAVFRFYDAVAATDGAEAALALESFTKALVEALRLKLYYLFHYHEEFKDEPLLRQLFPAPKQRRAEETRPVTEVERLTAKRQAQEVISRCEVLSQRLAPRMAVVGQVLRAVEQPGGLGVMKDFLSPEARTVRLLAMRLASAPVATQALQEALAHFNALNAALAEARRTHDAEGLEAAAFPVSEFAMACRRDPVLKEFFPPAA